MASRDDGSSTEISDVSQISTDEHDSSYHEEQQEESESRNSYSPIKILRESQKKRQFDDSQNFEKLDLFSLKVVNLRGNSQGQLKRNVTPKVEDVNKKRKIENTILKEERNETKDTWVNVSRPLTVDDLCIHKRKIEDLKKDINDLIFNKSDDRILVVSGPSGSGKSTAVKLLANMYLKEKIQKLKDSIIGSEISDMLGTTTTQVDEFIVEFNILKDSNRGNSSVSYFNEFLDQCKMLTGLNEKCVVIEELPNIFHRQTHYEFQNAITNWIESSSRFNLPPLIICVTEYDIENDLDWNNGTAFTIENVVKVETVLGFKLMQYENNGWNRIKFNKVAKTFLKKALNRVLSFENVKKNKVIDKKVDELAGLGDLRNAINTLEFWYKFQYDDSYDINHVEESISGKESGLDIFHTIGKVIYGTKHEDIEFEDFQKRHNFKIGLDLIRPDIITADNVSNEVMSHLIRFNLCCLENYSVIDPLVCDELNELMNILSLTDDVVKRSSISNSHNPAVLQNTSFYDCLGLRYYCEELKKKQPKSSSSFESGRKKVIFSRDSKLRKKLQDVNREILEFQDRRSKRMIQNRNYSRLNLLESVLIDGYYLSNIMSSFKFRYQQHLKGFGNGSRGIRVERIGGRFMNALTADDEFYADEDYSSEDDGASKQVLTGESLALLEREYFGINNGVPRADNYPSGEGSGASSGGEFESDPLEWTEEEDEDNGDKPGRDVVVTEKDNEDVFSDDSAVLETLF